MKNQYYTGTPTSRRFAVCPDTVLSGDPVLIGDPSHGTPIPAVALDDWQEATDGTTFLLNGSFLLTVRGVSQISPPVGKVLGPGDSVYAVGTFDATTNMTTDLTLSGTSGDTIFGKLDPSAATIASGDTDTAAIVILEG